MLFQVISTLCTFFLHQSSIVVITLVHVQSSTYSSSAVNIMFGLSLLFLVVLSSPCYSKPAPTSALEPIQRKNSTEGWNALNSTSKTRVRKSDANRKPKFMFDIINTLAQQQLENVPPAMRAPMMFMMGFSQQNVQNFVSTMQMIGQMIVNALVVMAVKQYFFRDLNPPDRQKASGITDNIVGILNVI